MLSINPFPAGIYLFKVNIKNTRIMCEICSELTIKTSQQCQYCSGIFIVNFEQISHIAQVVLLLTLNKQMPARLVAKTKKKKKRRNKKYPSHLFHEVKSFQKLKLEQKLMT